MLRNKFLLIVALHFEPARHDTLVRGSDSYDVVVSFLL